MKALPVIGGVDEAYRLHGIAHTAAIQTGVKGHALDVLIAEVFASLVKHANLKALQQHRSAGLRVVE